MNIKQIKAAFSLFIMVAPSGYASNIFVSLDTYEYNTNLADLDLSYEPVGVIIGAKFDLNERSFLQIQYGNWSEDNADVFAPTFSGSDFDSSLANIGFGYAWGKWDLYLAYTDLEDKMTVGRNRFSEFQAFGETGSSTLQTNLGIAIESGRWSRNARIGLQYDDSVTIAVLDPEQAVVRQENEALYATLMLGADYFHEVGDSKGCFFGININWYQELSSNDSVFAGNMNNLGFIADQDLSPFPGRGAPRGNNGLGGNGAVGLNRTTGDSFGVIGLYATYMFSERWSLDLSPSFGFSGDLNTKSLSLALNRKF